MLNGLVLFFIRPNAILVAAHWVVGGIAFGYSSASTPSGLRTLRDMRLSGLLLGLIFVSVGCRAYAFDPTSIAGAVGIMGGIEESVDIGFALSDLLRETGIDPQDDAELRATIERLEKLQGRAKDLEWSGLEIHQALSLDLSKAHSVQDKLRALRSMIEASKKIAEIMQLRPKAGERAAKIQDIRINSMMLDELQIMRRTQVLALLKEREREAKTKLYIHDLKRQGEKAHGRNLL